MKKKAVALMLSAVMVMGMASAVSVQAGVADKRVNPPLIRRPLQ